MFIRICYDTYILYMCQAIFDSPSDLLTLSITSTRYTAQRDCTRKKSKDSLTVKWFWRVAIFTTFGSDGQWWCQKSPTVGRSASSPGEDIWNMYNKKSVLMCKVTNDVEISSLNSYTCPYSFTPLASKSSIAQRRCGDSFKRKLDCISCHRSAAPRSNGANPEDDDTPTVT